MAELMKIREPRAYDVPGKPGLKSTYGWHPGMPPDIILRVSKTSLGTAGFCAQQYFLKYPLGIKEPANDNMIRGSNVHDAIEEFYQNMNLSYALSMRSYGYDEVKKYFLTHISEDKGYALGEEDHLVKYLDAEAKRFMTAEDEYFLPIGNEVSLDAVVEVDGVLVHLTGIVDRLFADEEGIPHVHELKTGVWSGKPKKWESMRKEMAYYVYLIKRCEHEVLGGLDVEWWGWDHTGADEIFRHIEAVRVKEVSSMMKSLKDLVGMHKQYTGNKNGVMFPLKDEGAVKYICEPWCAIKGFCPRYYEVLKPSNLRQEAFS